MSNSDKDGADQVKPEDSQTPADDASKKAPVPAAAPARRATFPEVTPTRDFEINIFDVGIKKDLF